MRNASRIKTKEKPNPMTKSTVVEKELNLADFRVLIVEDYPFVADLLSTSLREMGVGEVITASNGKEAQVKIMAANQFANSQTIDVMIMDWLMPEMDGKALLQWLRKQKKDLIRFLPVIVCSAYTSRPLVVESRDAGANEVIVKPVSAAEIARRIQYVINRPRPFVQSNDFFGPDRRRQERPFDGEERRVTKPQDIKTNHEQP